MNLKISTSGINNCISMIEQFKQLNDNEKIDSCLKRIVERCVTLVNENLKKSKDYDPTTNTFDGNEIPTITSEIKDNVGRVIASGKDVAFIEFGTGVRKSEHPLQYQIEGILPHGQYGYGQGGNPQGWYYSIGYLDSKLKGNYVHTYGIPAQRFLYNACKQLEQELPSIIREVYK